MLAAQPSIEPIEESDFHDCCPSIEPVDDSDFTFTDLGTQARRMQKVFNAGQRRLASQISDAALRKQAVKSGWERCTCKVVVWIAGVSSNWALGYWGFFTEGQDRDDTVWYFKFCILLVTLMGLLYCVFPLAASMVLAYNLEAASAWNLRLRYMALSTILFLGCITLVDSLLYIVLTSGRLIFDTVPWGEALWPVLLTICLALLMSCVALLCSFIVAPFYVPLLVNALAEKLDDLLQDELDSYISTKNKYRMMAKKVLTCKGVILFSAPYHKAGARIQELRAHFEQHLDNVLVFDPDQDIKLVARACLMEKKTQGLRWLQIWMDFFLLMKEKRDSGDTEKNKVIAMVPEIPLKDENGHWDLLDADKKLRGSAQHGEVRVAIAAGFVSEATGLLFQEYTHV